MSGGSMDYLCWKVEEIARQIADKATSPLHKAFATHLELVAKALHDLEWVWDCDKAPGDEVEAIMAVVSRADVLSEAVKSAEQARKDLEAALAAIKEGE